MNQKQSKNWSLWAFLIIGFLFLIQPNYIFAVEGTCSWHNGVNCSAGPDLDGSAICNDGWRDSSENYYSVYECTKDKHFCTTAQYSEIRRTSKLDYLEAKENEIYSKLSALNIQSLKDQEDAMKQGETLNFALGQIQNVNRDNAIKALQLNAEWNTVHSQYLRENNSVMELCHWMGEDNYNQQQNELLKLKYQQLQNLSNQNNSLKAEPKKDIQTSQVISIEPTADPIEMCNQKLGPQGIVRGQKFCGCIEGYEIVNNYCVLAKICPINSTKIGHDCQCNEGYKINNQNQCEIIPSIKKDEVRKIIPNTKTTSQKVPEKIIEKKELLITLATSSFSTSTKINLAKIATSSPSQPTKSSQLKKIWKSIWRF